MIGKDYMVVKFFADYPEWIDWVLQVFTHFDIFQSLEDCEETKLGFIFNSM